VDPREGPIPIKVTVEGFTEHKDTLGFFPRDTQQLPTTTYHRTKGAKWGVVF
jgi:hypothetical protein